MAGFEVTLEANFGSGHLKANAKGISFIDEPGG
jgi:hypothetical protein